MGQIHVERHGNTEKLSCMFILSSSSVYSPRFLSAVCYFAVALTPASHYTCESTASICHITRVDYLSHTGKSLTTRANLLPYLWPVLYKQQVLDHLIESLPNTFITCTSHEPHENLLAHTFKGLSQRTAIHVHVSSIYITTSIDHSTIHAWRGRFLTSWWKGVWLHTCNKARTYTYMYTYKSLHLQPACKWVFIHCY